MQTETNAALEYFKVKWTLFYITFIWYKINPIVASVSLLNVTLNNGKSVHALIYKC